MRSHTYRLFGVTAAALLLAAGTAGAQGKGHGKGEEHGNGKGRGHDNAQVQERDDHDGRDGRDLRTNGGVYNGGVNNGGVYQGRDRRDDRDGRDVYGNGRKVPPGLAKKPGGMPPGQYKKRYGTNEGASVLSDILNRRGYSVMRTQPYGNSQYVYYRTPDGRMQRAIVTPGTDRLGFSNVPTMIVREVLARLY